MNTDTDTRGAHLDLGDLIAGAAGQPAGGRAAAHLAGCESCQREMDRWSLVAEGVRGLAAAAPQAPQPARPRRTGRRGPAGPWRHALLAAGGAAAALVLLLGAGIAAGYVHVHLTLPGTSGPGTGPALTAVSGCTGLELASGTLTQVNGTSVVIRTASGKAVTVTTTASTRVTVAGALRSDITDGASVIVLGSRSGTAITAASVVVGPAPGGPGGNGALRVTPPPGWAVVRGTAAGVSAAGFTVVTSGGTRVPVTLTGGTHVVVPRAGLGQLRAGVTTAALGHARPGGTLSAIGVLQQPPGPIQVQFGARVPGCSPASITDALAAALGSGG